MSYRNKKRKVAIWVLDQICGPQKMVVTAITEAGKRREVNTKNYDWFNLKDLLKKTPFDKNLVRDSCDLLFLKNHIDILENEIDRFDIKIKAYREGEVALREDIYQDEIDNYSSDKRYRSLRWMLPLIIVILTVVNIAYTFYKDGKATSDIKGVENRIDNIEGILQTVQLNSRIQPQQKNNMIVDTSVKAHTIVK